MSKTISISDFKKSLSGCKIENADCMFLLFDNVKIAKNSITFSNINPEHAKLTWFDSATISNITEVEIINITCISVYEKKYCICLYLISPSKTRIIDIHETIPMYFYIIADKPPIF